MTISPEKQRQIEETAGLIGEAFGALIGSLISAAIIAGVMYAILHFLIGLTVTYLQVFGVILILDFIKNFLKK
jgi:hypothetical protein